MRPVCQISLSVSTVILAIFLVHNSQGKHDVSKMLDHIISDQPDEFDAIKYDKTLRPNFGGSGVPVGITMNIDSLGPIDEVNMNFRVDISFRQYWEDSRLNFSLYKENKFFQNLTLSHSFLKRIWVPDTYFPDSLQAFKQDVMVPNVLIRLSPDGSILYSSRVTVIAKCPMDLHYFPMDSQTCTLYVECYGYTTKDLHLYWYTGNSSVANTHKKLAQFTLEDFTLEEEILKFSTGSFSQLRVHFHFKRDLLYFILQSYVPSTFIVMCSWVAFWINRSGIPGRACLSITTVLSLITLIGSTNAKLPNVSAVKALDVYFGICFVYVFGGLLEFATVIYLETKEKKQTAARKAKEEEAKKYRDKVKQSTERQLMDEIETNFTHAIPRRVSTLGDTVQHQARSILLEYKSMKLSENISALNIDSIHGDPPTSTSSIPAGAVSHLSISNKAPQPPKWTASTIEKYSRILFPSSFCLFQVLYWSYYNIKEGHQDGGH